MGANSTSALVEQTLERWSPGTFWVAAEGRSSVTNELLVGALRQRGARAELVRPTKLSGLARPGDVVLGRLVEYDVVHVNAEFAVQASDHEPSVARINMIGRP